jgi:hypothetical protein
MNRSSNRTAGKRAAVHSAVSTAATLVALSANSGGGASSGGNANAAGGGNGNPATPARKPVKLTKKQAVGVAVKLLARATGADPKAIEKRLALQRAGGSNATIAARAVALGPIALERQRRTDLESLSQVYKLGEDFVNLGLAKNWDIATARTEAQKMLSQKTPNLSGAINVGADNNLVSLSGAIQTAIRLRAGNKVEAPKDNPAELAIYQRAQKMRALSLVDMGRHYLSGIGYRDAWEISRSRVVALCVSRRELRQEAGGGQMVMLAESIGDFPGVLKDAVNKTLLQAYRDASPTWQKWARRATAPDFKVINRAALSESPDLKLRNQGKGIDYVQLGDTNETYALAEYSGGIKLTRQAIINDDLDAFQRIPMLQGNAAARKEDDVAYVTLTANAAMVNDNVALFHATHKNLVASGGAAPSVAELTKAYQLMRVQKGPAGAARLNLQPKFIIVPVALEAPTLQLINSTQLLAIISTTSAAPQTTGSANPFADRLTVISNPRLDDVSTVQWYLAANYADGQCDTVEVCFLEDEPEPVLKAETDFDTDDQKYAVRHTVAAKAVDFRGLVKDNGQ